MFQLNDETIENGIASISGHIVTVVADRTGKPHQEIARAFFRSDAYALLCDKETGCYWDSIDELIEKFLAESNL
jgi:hypothetical protein